MDETMKGRCLCGTVVFEFQGQATPIELCHCVRCQRAYGSAFAATFYVKAADFRWLQGRDTISMFDAPIRDKPPPYRHSFCRVCGSPLPIVREDTPTVEIPAGCVQGEFGSRPLHEQWVRQSAPWWSVDLPLRSYDETVPLHERTRIAAASESTLPSPGKVIGAFQAFHRTAAVKAGVELDLFTAIGEALRNRHVGSPLPPCGPIDVQEAQGEQESGGRYADEAAHALRGCSCYHERPVLNHLDRNTNPWIPPSAPRSLTSPPKQWRAHGPRRSRSFGRSRVRFDAEILQGGFNA